jgi:hypothetical protein
MRHEKFSVSLGPNDDPPNASPRLRWARSPKANMEAKSVPLVCLAPLQRTDLRIRMSLDV